MLPTIGFLETYTLMMIIGIVAVFVLLEIYYRKINPNKKHMLEVEFCGVIAIAIGIVGAYLVQNLYDFINDPSHYHWNWSLTFYGGLLFGVAAFFAVYFLYTRKRTGGILFSEVFVIGPAGITIAHGFGRIGCFLSGCCYGMKTDAWYGVTFPGMDHKVVPTNLFEAIFLFLLTTVLLVLVIKKKGKYNFPIYLVTYGIWRFFIESVRDDYRGSFVTGLTPSQFWSILLVLAGIGLGVATYLLGKKAIPTSQEDAKSAEKKSDADIDSKEQDVPVSGVELDK